MIGGFILFRNNSGLGIALQREGSPSQVNPRLMGVDPRCVLRLINYFLHSNNPNLSTVTGNIVGRVHFETFRRFADKSG